ncbi:MAG: P1 family peptidase [Candidatus Rokubacteria bacterium]|nr:P1 family peptidase [Candidatus Rokubacteria bacterium]
MITDVPGIRVGHATDRTGLTGCSVVLCDRPAVGGVELRGWACGVHGLDFLDPRHLVPTLDGVLLSGGSAFGLEAVFGVMQWLEERGVGFRAGPTVVPHVAGAILFDLSVGDHRARPTRAMGYQACLNARAGQVEEGSIGAGTGATVGKLFGIARAMKGGIGSASIGLGEAIVGALVAVNAFGDIRDPETGRLLAGTRRAPGDLGLVDTAAELSRGAPLRGFGPLQHTTIGVLATNCRLTKPEALKVAQLGMTGFARAVSPPHTAVDGDVLFCLSVGDVPAEPTAVGLAAAEAAAQAIVRAIRAATPLPGLPAWHDLPRDA